MFPHNQVLIKIYASVEGIMMYVWKHESEDLAEFLSTFAQAGVQPSKRALSVCFPRPIVCPMLGASQLGISFDIMDSSNLAQGLFGTQKHQQIRSQIFIIHFITNFRIKFHGLHGCSGRQKSVSAQKRLNSHGST